MATSVGDVLLWVNTFIPRNIPNFTQVIQTGVHRGKTAIPLPFYARPVHWGKPDGDGFLTDQRGFSVDPQASARVTTMAALRLDSPQLADSSITTSGTREVDIDTGKQLDFAVADLSDCEVDGVYDAISGDDMYQHGKSRNERLDQLFRLIDRIAQTDKPDDRAAAFMLDMYSMSEIHPWSPGPMAALPKEEWTYAMKVKMVCAASDPLIALAPDIDYKLTFIIGRDLRGPRGRLLVGVWGFLDDFPAFEAYVRYQGTTKALFQVDVPSGTTNIAGIDVPTGNRPFDLIGDAARPIIAAVTF
jgi:hypothetical protein